ncbi:hypothetical protein LJC30_01610 [Odoribacter sp. OttesenSCG-928-L07]|nr:hypothetical protein [Odoribacter sp. OttesenSCG-928-L07]MDL2239331.1 hypothetical protein [Bacteroidales bacterium OttesenSCG-928-L14]MDL2240376.1 hypothetical protein [Bacteroidales bacterium OttesenSCG-928-K22]
MRKIGVFIITLIVALSFSSCEKDGVYNPKKKISKIHIQQNDYDKFLSEEWTWNKDKLMKRVFFDDNSEDNTYQDYEYEGNLLSKINNSNGSEINFVYTDKKLSKVEYSRDGQIIQLYEITHENNKVSQVYIATNYNFKGENIKLSPLDLFLPKECVDIFNKNISECKLSKNDNMYITINDYTWDGDNIVIIDSEQSYGDEKTIRKHTFNYTNSLNPYYGFFLGSHFGLSKNNPSFTKVTIDTEGYHFESTYNYEYKFDSGGKFPTEIYEYNNSLSYRQYYEYLD